METDHSPESQSPFITDFSRAMQLCADSQHQVLSHEITRMQYLRILCVAVIASDIAEERLYATDPDKSLKPEDLGLRFENYEPMILPTILERGVRAAGYSDFGFGDLTHGGTTYSRGHLAYSRKIKDKFGIKNFELRSEEDSFADREDFLHALLENDPRIVFVSRKSK